MSDKNAKPHGPTSEGSAVPQYEIEGRAMRANMEKLRALRLAKEAAEAASAPPKPVKKAGGSEPPPRRRRRLRRRNCPTGSPISARAVSDLADVVPAKAGTHDHRISC
jgi:hypothetical protein